MADAPPNSDGQAIDPPGKVKKKAAKGPKKPRSKLTSAELVKLDAGSAKRRNRRPATKGKNAAAKFAAERDELEAARCKADVDEKEDIVNKAHALLMLGISRPASFSAAPIVPASTGSSVARPPQCPSPMSRTTPLSPGFPPARSEGQTRFTGSPDVGVIAPSTPHPSVVIDLNVTPGSSSSGQPSVEMQKKQARPPCRRPASCSTKCQHQRQRSMTPSTTSSWRMSSTRVGMAMPTIPRRPRVGMATASTLPMKTLRPMTMLTTTMVTHGMKMMTSIAKLMVMKKRKASILGASPCSLMSSPKEQKHKRGRRAFVRDHTHKRRTS